MMVMMMMMMMMRMMMISFEIINMVTVASLNSAGPQATPSIGCHS
jgi:hypothetical protein